MKKGRRGVFDEDDKGGWFVCIRIHMHTQRYTHFHHNVFPITMYFPSQYITFPPKHPHIHSPYTHNLQHPPPPPSTPTPTTHTPIHTKHTHLVNMHPWHKLSGNHTGRRQLLHNTWHPYILGHTWVIFYQLFKSRLTLGFVFIVTLECQFFLCYLMM